MKKRLEQYILEGPWEKQLNNMMAGLEKWAIWPVMILAALYFGAGFVMSDLFSGIIRAFMR